jgi:hypothetical protein
LLCLSDQSQSVSAEWMSGEEEIKHKRSSIL